MTKTFVCCYTKPLAEPSNIGILKEGDDFEKWAPAARQEIVAWHEQLKRTFPLQHFEIQECRSKSGTWWEVVIPYDDDNPDEAERVFNTVEELPYNWDYKAKEQLGKEYFQQFKN